MPINHRTLTLQQPEIQSKLKVQHSAISEEARNLSQSLLESPFRYGLEKEIITFLTTNISPNLTFTDSTISISYTSPKWLSALPVPYGVKGGAAREILRLVLKRDPPESPRDLDILRKGQSLNTQDQEIAKKFMPDDYVKGANVELFQNQSKYFGSRDLTLNECFYLNSSLNISLIGILDTIGFVIRPCHYRLGTLHRKPALQGQLALKMIRLQVEAELRGEAWKIVGIPNEVQFSDFDLALHLAKAFERSERHAREFIKRCGEAGLFDNQNSFEEIMEEIKYLSIGEGAVLGKLPWNR